MTASLTRTLVAAALATTTAGATDYARQVLPILNAKCAECHSEAKGKDKGDFAIDRKADMEKQVKAGSPDASNLVIIVSEPADSEDVMPPKGKNHLTPAEIGIIKAWITEGASFEAGGAAPAPAGSAGILSWTNSAGKTLQAAFDRIDGDAVVIRTADGTFYRVPLASLDAASQTQAKAAAGQ
jgi:hypothetical protein